MDRERAGYIIGNLKDCEEYDPCEIQEAKAMAIDALWTEPKTGHCEDCKHFRKLPLRTDTVGKCNQHWGGLSIMRLVLCRF